jgi:hypothetical protein
MKATPILATVSLAALVTLLAVVADRGPAEEVTVFEPSTETRAATESMSGELFAGDGPTASWTQQPEKPTF